MAKKQLRITITLPGDTSNIVRLLGEVWKIKSPKTIIRRALENASLYYLGIGYGSEAEQSCVGPIRIRDKRKAKDRLKEK